MSERARSSAGIQATAQDVSIAHGRTLQPMGSLPGGMRSPRDIVASRNEREAAKEAARRAEVERDEEQARQEETFHRRSAEQRAQATAGKQPARHSGRSQSSGLEALQGAAPSRAFDDSSPPQPSDIGLTGWSVPRGYSAQSTQQSQQQPQQTRPTSSRQQVPPVIAPVASNTKQQPATGASFPHAFERWEQLSAHWEGLTSYWIRKLQQNTEKVQHDMTLKQLSDQVSDLSAAGANLFHAVVELQRLRASSERKFGRWFEQVRTDQEASAAKIAELERLLQEEKDAQLNAPQVNIPYFNARITEINLENTVIKAESRRAWDEVGKRERADAEMQLMLRSGRPIYIGGIQVVPTQASYSQSGTMVRHPPQQQQYANYAMPNYPQAQGPMGSPAHQQAIAQGYGIYEPHQPSPTDTDPFSGQNAPQSAHRPTTSGGFQPFNSGPSPPPIGSMRSTTGPPQQYPGMSPQVQRMQQQGYTTAPQYPFPSPGGMPPGTMPFYHQPQQYIHQQGASASTHQYQQQPQTYADSGSPSEAEEDDSPWLEPGPLDPPPPLESQHHSSTYGQHQHEPQQEPGSPEHSYTPEQHDPPPRGGLYLQYSPEGTRPHPQQAQQQQGYTQHPSAHPPAQVQQPQQHEALYDEPHSPPEQPLPEQTLSASEEEPVQYEGAGYGRHAADWEGVAAHQHYATRLSDVLEEEDSMKSPSSQRSSRVPTLSQRRST